MQWWHDVEKSLSGIPHAIAGGQAANAYAPPRASIDLDVAIVTRDAARCATALTRDGWQRTGELAGIPGSTWRHPEGHALDILEVHEPWAETALREAAANLIDGLPTLPMPYLVLMKLDASRTTDLGDVARMLGGADDPTVARARELVERHGNRQDVQDFDQLVAMGRLERGVIDPPRPDLA